MSVEQSMTRRKGNARAAKVMGGDTEEGRLMVVIPLGKRGSGYASSPKVIFKKRHINEEP
jgi:hypothetical protein